MEFDQPRGRNESLSSQEEALQRLCQQLRDHPERIPLALDAASARFPHLGPPLKSPSPEGLELAKGECPRGAGHSLMQAALEAQRERTRPHTARALHGVSVEAHGFLASYAKRRSLEALMAQVQAAPAPDSLSAMPPAHDTVRVLVPEASKCLAEARAAEDGAHPAVALSQRVGEVPRLHPPALCAAHMATEVAGFVATSTGEEGTSRPRILSPPQFTLGALNPGVPCQEEADKRDRGLSAREPRMLSPCPLSTRERSGQSAQERCAGIAIFAGGPCQNRRLARRCASPPSVVSTASLSYPMELCRMPQIVKCASMSALRGRSHFSPDYRQPKGGLATYSAPQADGSLQRQLSVPQMTVFKPVAPHRPRYATPPVRPVFPLKQLVVPPFHWVSPALAAPEIVAPVTSQCALPLRPPSAVRPARSPRPPQDAS